jgi:hypothetical protein
MCGVTASQVPLSWTGSVSTTIVGYNLRPALHEGKFDPGQRD